ncbi:MAG: twin-arginine translocase TatA/TatE family subunit [Bacteroidales bacterium]|jgi:sec-independent protein translocase protein TatA|nr:twin-arginine translocase TatA/TatE family subunit [Bacteroidales bacterium]
MQIPLLLLGLGAQELIFIALIILLLFGGRKIPEMMRGLGRGVKSFKEGMNEIDPDHKDVSEQGKNQPNTIEHQKNEE